MIKKESIEIYTDGSYNHIANTGSWAAIIIVNEAKEYIKGIQYNSTHNRMELLAVVEALDFLRQNQLTNDPVLIFTDSQYVAKIPKRAYKLKQQQYLTKKNLSIRNADLVKVLIEQLATFDATIIKVEAHQKEGDIENLNREVDKLVRKTMRKASSNQ